MLKKGVLKAWDETNYKAKVRLIGDANVWLENVPVSRGIPSAEMVTDRNVLLVAVDPSNPNDCVVVAVWT